MFEYTCGFLLVTCVGLCIRLWRVADERDFQRQVRTKLAAELDELAREQVRLESECKQFAQHSMDVEVLNQQLEQKLSLAEGQRESLCKTVEFWKDQCDLVVDARDKADSQRELLCRAVLRLKAAAKKKESKGV